MHWNTILKILFLFSASGQLAIGRFYDDRLNILGINIASIVSIGYIFSAIFLLLSIKNIVIHKTKLIYYIFYAFIIVINPLLWLTFGLEGTFDSNNYGLFKYLNLIFLFIPISVIIIEKFNYKDSRNMLFILFGVVLFLAFLALFGFAISQNPDSKRLSVLGGGPIIFSRWMGFGILFLLFFPSKKRMFLRLFLAVVLFVLALGSGSRGPIFALSFILFIFLLLNFKKKIIRVSFVLFFIIAGIKFCEIDTRLSDFGKVKRIYMNYSSGKFNQKSASTRPHLFQGAILVVTHFPFGVGSGNWQLKANELNSSNLIPLEYPHNIFLEVASDYGIFSALLLIILFLHVFYLSFNRMRIYSRDPTSLYPLLFYLLLFFFLNSLISGDINDSRLLFVIVSFIIIDTPLIDKTKKINNANYL